MSLTSENSESEKIQVMKEKAFSLHEKVTEKLKSLLKKAHDNEEYLVKILLSCSTHFMWKEFAIKINDDKSIFEYLDIFKTTLEENDIDYFDAESTIYQLTKVIEDLNMIVDMGRFDKALSKIEFNEKPTDKGVLGKYAFAANRARENTVPFEKNTKIEQQIYLALIKHFRGDPLSKKNANIIHKILLTNQYDDVFNEPVQDAIYRGMAVTEKWINKLLDVNSSKTIIEKEFTFEPKLGASSWTTLKKTAEKFALKNATNKNTYAIILTAYAKNNKKQFVSGAGGLYRVEPYTGYANEFEVIGLGDITVSSIEII